MHAKYLNAFWSLRVYPLHYLIIRCLYHRTHFIQFNSILSICNFIHYRLNIMGARIMILQGL